MPRSDWRSIAAVGLAVALYLTWIVAAVVHTMPALEYDPAQYQSETERRQGREDQDTHAQIWMAWVGVAQVFIGAVGLLGLAATVIFARNAWLEAQSANSDARDFYVGEQRPWLHLEVEAESWEEIGQDHAKITFRLTAENLGRMPAMHVQFFAPHIGLESFTGDELDKWRDEIAAQKDEFKRIGGDTIFAGKDRKKWHTVQTRVRRVGEHVQAMFHLPVYVLYVFSGSDAVHVTPVVKTVYLWLRPLLPLVLPREAITQIISPMSLPPD